MNPILLTKAMKASISEVLETMFFMVIDVVSESEKKESVPDSSHAIGVVLDFGGPACGCFRLMVPSILAHESTADFLGIDIDALARDDVCGTLMEMVNMLAGNTLSHYDADLVFDLSVPRMIDEEAGDRSPSGQAGYCSLDIQTLANRMSLVVNYEDKV